MGVFLLSIVGQASLDVFTSSSSGNCGGFPPRCQLIGSGEWFPDDLRACRGENMTRAEVNRYSTPTGNLKVIAVRTRGQDL